jgi:hypothetical protein
VRVDSLLGVEMEYERPISVASLPVRLRLPVAGALAMLRTREAILGSAHREAI